MDDHHKMNGNMLPLLFCEMYYVTLNFSQQSIVQPNSHKRSRKGLNQIASWLHTKEKLSLH